MSRRSFRLPFRSPSQVAAEVDEELHFHLAMVAERLREQGWTPAEAAAEARRRFGDVDHTRDYCRAEDQRRETEKRRMTLLDELGQDLRYAIRMLRSSPGFALVALATLALGIGANTAIFSVVRTVLLEPLPFTAADRIVRVWQANPESGVTESSFSEPDFLDIARETRLAESMGGFWFADGLSSVDLSGEGEPERLSVALVTPGFFETLRPHPVVGRVLAPDEHIPGTGRAVVISYTLWQRRFAGDPAIVGRTIRLNQQPFNVVGVMAPGFTYPAAQTIDAWIPLSFFGPDDIGRARSSHFLSVIARLEPGVTPERFRAEVAGISARLSTQYPENRGWTAAAVRTIRESIVGDVRRPLLVVVTAVAMVLLVSCVNIASLLLARASVRQRELAVRAALGAGRGRIVRQLLTESLVLAVAGGALGAALAWVAVRALVASGAAELPGATQMHIDGVVLAFTLVVSIVAGLLFGAMPALRAAGPVLERSLRAGTRGSVGARGQRLRSTLVIMEVALAVVLVVGATLATKSFARLLAVDPGFRPENALVVQLSIPEKYDGMDRSVPYYQKVLATVRGVRGVIAAGSAKDLPTRGNGEMARADQIGIIPPGTSDGTVQIHHVSTDYFRAMGIPLRGGREFQPTDGRGAPFVFIVNEALARRYWPGENAVGKVLHLGDQSVQVVGVVADVRQRGPGEATEPMLYLHALQNMRSRMNIVIRTSGSPLAIAGTVRQAIHALDPEQSITSVSTLEDVLGGAVARPRLLAWLLGVFGSVGLLLGALGIYGLLAFAVAQRRQEIGVRVALGAPPRSVLRLVVGQGVALAVVGVVIGVLGARLLTRQMDAVLFGISPSDAGTFVEVVAVLLGAALLASWIPARRALRIDPATALRYD
jgi:predicted permease